MLFLALFRTFGIFMQVKPFSAALLLAGRLLGISFLGGFGAGVAYMLVRQPTRRLGAVSPYIAGISAVAAGFAIMMAIQAQSKGTLHLPSQVEVVPYAITALVIGLFVGHQVRHLD